jgi:hypothetical protein
MVSQDLKEQLLESVRSTPSRTRGSSRVGAWLILPSSCLVAAVLFFSFDGVHHGQGRPAWFYTASLLGWTAVAALSLWAALSRGGSAVGRSGAWLFTIAAGTPAILLAMMYAFAIAEPEVTLLHPERLGLKCLGLALAGAAFPMLGLMLVRRGSDPVHPAATGAALGAACGACAGVMVELWCPVGAPRHVAVGHVLPIVVVAILGASIGSRFIAMRSLPPTRPRRG